jgi:hypothetical protein
MRQTIIPAQITTLEDKIAGNLNFTQISLLMIPIFLTLGAYAFMKPTMNLNPPKIAFILITALIFIVLSIRVKGKVILEWAIIYSRFSLRPSLYLFDKNDQCARELESVDLGNYAPLEKPSLNLIKTTRDPALIPVRLKLDQLLSNKGMGLKYTLKEGSLHVAYSKIQS